MSTATPAVIRASLITDFLAEAGADDVPSHYTVCSIGVYNHHTDELIECDTAPLYAAVGADVGDEITIGATEIKISRYIVMQHDDALT